MTEPRQDWTYDQRLNNGRGAYRDTSTGRVISFDRATELINQSIDRTREDVTIQINTMLDNGQMSAADWQAAMAQTIKDAYIQQAELAAGGRDNMTQADWGVVGGAVREQYNYLTGFAQEIADGKLSLGQIQMRSDMYINSAREAYWRIKERQVKKQGFDSERWITAGDDRVCPTCLEAGQMGWVKIGTFAPPGSGVVRLNPRTNCYALTNCRCTLEYRKTGE